MSNHCFAPNPPFTWSNNFKIFAQVSEDGGVWTIKTSTTLKTMELKFKVCSLHTTNQVEHPDYALIDVFRQIMPRNAEHASFNPFPVRDLHHFLVIDISQGSKKRC